MKRSCAVLTLVCLVFILESLTLGQQPKFKLDHFHGYQVTPDPGRRGEVALQGQFDKEPIRVRVRGPVFFSNPVSKNGEPILDKNAHLNWYRLRQAEEEPIRTVLFRNQFGEQKVVIEQPIFLLAPTKKIHKRQSFPLSDRLDHFKCYRVSQAEPVSKSVKLADQFGNDENDVSRPVLFAVPVEKKHRDKLYKIKNERDHLVIYRIRPREHQIEIKVSDQFGTNRLKVRESRWLCVPTEKIEFSEE